MKTAAMEKEQARFTVEIRCSDGEYHPEAFPGGSYTVETDGLVLVTEPYEGEQHTVMMGKLNPVHIAMGLSKLEEEKLFLLALDKALHKATEKYRWEDDDAFEEDFDDDDDDDGITEEIIDPFLDWLLDLVNPARRS